MNPYAEQITKCIALLQEAGVPQDIIDNSFIPEETETFEEVLGSVYMAIQDAKMDEAIIERIINEVFNSTHPLTVEVEPDTFAKLVEENKPVEVNQESNPPGKCVAAQ